LIDGIFMACTGIWVACNTPMLPTPWQDSIVVACLAGIAYCLSCWVESNKVDTDSRSPMAWTKAQAAIVAGVGVLLAAATTAFAIREFSSPSVEDIFKYGFTGRYLEKAPPVVVLRPSSGEPPSSSSTDHRMVARSVTLGQLMYNAYGPLKFYVNWSENRVILPPGVGDGKFDFLVAVPDRPQETLQAEIKKQLGLAAHYEKREADVLVLSVSNPGVIGLAVTKGGDCSDNGHDFPGRGRFDFNNMPIDDLRDFLEIALGKPVVNETELTQRFSGSLRWTHQSDEAAERKEIQTALSDQFGLALAPSHQPVEMLIVEKAQ
jgi:uncharacterized protein (TIGR03435 family)